METDKSKGTEHTREAVPERRKSMSDRREFGHRVKFPYKDHRGTVILRDRRKQPDRRLSNFEINTAEMDEEEFQAYLENFQWKL